MKEAKSYDALERRRVDQVPEGSKVKLPDDEAGRMFLVGGMDRYGFMSLYRSKSNRLEVSAQPSQLVIIHEEATA